MKNKEFGTDESGEQKVGHFELLEDVVLSLGILGRCKRYEDIAEVLPDTSRTFFHEVIFSSAQYRQNPGETFQFHLSSPLLSHFIEKEKGYYTLSQPGSEYFDTLITRYLEYTDLKPELQDMIDRATALGVDKLQ